jgi:hypothetical protein
MANPNKIREVEVLIKQWFDLDKALLVRSQADINQRKNLELIILQFNEILKIVSPIIGNFSDRILEVLKDTISKSLKVLEEVSAYSLNDYRHNIGTKVLEMTGLMDNILDVRPDILAISTAMSPKFEQGKDLADAIQKLNEKSEKDAKEIENLKIRLEHDLNDFEKRYKDQFNQSEFIAQQEIFSGQATKFRNSSYWWLALTGISLVIFILTLVFVFNNFCFELKCFTKIENINYDQLGIGSNKTILYLEIFKSVSYRLLIISFVGFLVGFCIRNYNTNMHNYTVNQHRAHSLAAALRLLDRAKTNEGNDNIMIQAANTIFSHQSTGYNKKNPINMGNGLADKAFDKFINANNLGES